ncbi:MAG: DUF503 domain-containing protein [Sedimentisphaerales bacterium]|nr:DUF503 domain-containing protein [Sedimentisphaerales bacterium]
MIVGVLRMQVSVFDAMTLKDKRRVITSLKDRLGRKFNVSVAEVEHQESIRTSILAVAMVANERRFVESAMSGIVEFVRRIPPLSLIDYHLETY